MSRSEYKKSIALSSSKLTAFSRELQGLPPWTGNEKFNQFGIDFHRMILEPQKGLQYQWFGADAANLSGMKASAMRSGSLTTVLRHPLTKTEQWHTGHIQVDGMNVPFRGILDIQNPFLGVCADLKTTGVPTVSKFVQSCNDYNYWKQAYIYQQISGLETFLFFGVKKTKPFNIYVVNTAQYRDEMEQGKLTVQNLTRLYIEKHGIFWENQHGGAIS